MPLDPAAYLARRRLLFEDVRTVRDRNGSAPVYQTNRAASETRILTSKRGTRVVRKRSNRNRAGDAVKEHVASVVGFALDPERRRLVTPAVVAGPEEIYVEFLNGPLGLFWPGDGYCCCECALRDEIQTRRDDTLGQAFTVLWALDFLTENADRHLGNLILAPGGRLGAFDHAFAFEGKPQEMFEYQQRVKLPTSVMIDRWEENLRGVRDLLNDHGPVGVNLLGQKPRLPSAMMAKRLRQMRQSLGL